MSHRLIEEEEDDDLAPGEVEREHGHGHGHGHGHSHGAAAVLGFLRSFRGTRGPLVRLLGLLRTEWPWVLSGAAALVIATGVNVVVPYSLGRILNDAVTDGSVGAVAQAAALFLAVYAVGSFMTALRVYCLTVAGEKIVHSLRQLLYGRVLLQPIAFFDAARSGELVNRIAADCELIRLVRRRFTF